MSSVRWWCGVGEADDVVGGGGGEEGPRIPGGGHKLCVLHGATKIIIIIPGDSLRHFRMAGVFN